jgi:uncharacterized protein affecting Mg2+/Co2+ transport
VRVEEVRGEGVVGRFSIVRSGWKETYRSQSVGLFDDWMEGDFTFVPGTCARPAGAEFTVACPKLVFAEPDFIF